MRQKYKDVSIHDKVLKQYDLCQLKYDGIWCMAEVVRHKITYYSRTGNIKKEETNSAGIPNGLYIGELMYGSEWSTDPSRQGLFYVFDIIRFEEHDLKDVSFVERYKQLRRALLSVLPKHWCLVRNYSTLDAKEIWNKLVDTKQYEGLVFRKRTDIWTNTVLRAKFEADVDLTAVDFVEGEGKHTGRLGAIIAKCDKGLTHRVGGGLSDGYRHSIWNNKNQYKGRVFKVTYKKKFKSGKLRHPNFSGWHSEK